MSQHITGEVGQSIRQDFGEFISVGEVRLRRSLIVAYNGCPIVDDVEGRAYGIKALVNNGWIGIPVGTKEESKKELERLDWIFKKERD